ncbi:hypothetical protein G7Y89_g135 [Cudoniella acicularis]|uniref:Protein kinase domain-containing protein n=1 Tax=Cudoniella acicularis TaxID=354080 RepID=A0A8H4RZD1_9HELO|nr:hypothetical protein G7Y89_g135 [Cudoniella acicularis]
MVRTSQKPPKVYKNLRSLARLFRHKFQYTVQEIGLTIANEPDLFNLLQSSSFNKDDLQIVYYIGGIEHKPWADWNGMIPVPISQTGLVLDQQTDWFTRLNQDPRPEAIRWLEILIQMPNLISDILVILDCSPLEIESMEILDFGSGTSGFEVMTPGYKDSSREVGMFTSSLAELLESATDLENQKVRKEFITTDWLIGQLSNTNHLPHLAFEPSLICNTVEDDYLAHVILEPVALPSFEQGSHLELPRYDYVKLFNNVSLIYENGITEVFKAQIPKGAQESQEAKEITVYVIKSFTPKNVTQAKSIALAFRTERNILCRLSTWKHTHILDFFGSFEVLSEFKFGSFGLVLPFAEGGDLNQFLRLPRPPNWLFTGPGCIPFCKALFVQTKGIVDALKFLHDKTSSAGYVIHCDIKPANILVHNATFKIGDFGSSRMKEADETSKTEWGFGTPMYAPPETTIEDSDSYGRARDVWALGCVMLEILVLLLHGFRQPAIVEIFEDERRESSYKGTRIYSRTMSCVEVWVENIGKLIEKGHQRDRNTWVDGDWSDEQEALRIMLMTVQGMLKVNRLERIDSSQAAENLAINIGRE